MIELKNNKELVVFVLMNIFGSPFIFIVSLIPFGIYGLIGNFVIFYALFRYWKHITKSDAKLRFNLKLPFFSK